MNALGIGHPATSGIADDVNKGDDLSFPFLPSLFALYKARREIQVMRFNFHASATLTFLAVVIPGVASGQNARDWTYSHGPGGLPPAAYNTPYAPENVPTPYIETQPAQIPHYDPPSVPAVRSYVPEPDDSYRGSSLPPPPPPPGSDDDQ